MWCPLVKMAKWTRASSTIAVVIILLKAVNCDRSSEIAEACTNPIGRAGICTGLAKCQSIRSYLQRLHGRWPTNLRSFLIRSHCGFDDKTPKICCPPNFEAFDEPDPDSDSGAATETSQDGTRNRYEPDRSEQAEGNKRWLPLPTPVEQHPNLRLLTQHNCGDLLTERIRGGNKTALREYPWMALISYNTDRGLRFQCGGTVVSSRYILTAAHCLAEPNKLAGVRVGEHDLSTDVDCQGPPDHRDCSEGFQDFLIEKAIPHKEFIGTIQNQLPRLQNDIGLLRIKGAIDFTYENVMPICLPTTRDLQRLDLDDKDLTVTGWGITEDNTMSEQLLQITISVVPNDVCGKIHNGSTGDGVGFRQMCAGGVKGVDSCSGDSGGPIQRTELVEDSQSFVQFGIVSYGPRSCGTKGKPGVYTRVAYYMDWILDQMKP